MSVTRVEALEAEANRLRAEALETEVKTLRREARRLDRAAMATNDLGKLVPIITRLGEIEKRLIALRIHAERMAKRLMPIYLPAYLRLHPDEGSTS
jgi:hypothetical protein